ncbi:MAG TPA: hypothetical protein VNU21_07195, partial [Usitatibacter sp.]|nr:hypothetical protein [Usitatibacter sp.]
MGISDNNPTAWVFQAVGTERGIEGHGWLISSAMHDKRGPPAPVSLFYVSRQNMNTAIPGVTNPFAA